MIRVLGVASLVFCSSLSAFGEKFFIVADEWPQMDVFEQFLSDAGHSVEKAEQDKMPESLSGYDGVVQFVHGMLEDEPARKLMDYLTSEEGQRRIGAFRVDGQVLFHPATTKG